MSKDFILDAGSERIPARLKADFWIRGLTAPQKERVYAVMLEHRTEFPRRRGQWWVRYQPSTGGTPKRVDLILRAGRREVANLPVWPWEGQ